jgi:hypothetical protein
MSELTRKLAYIAVYRRDRELACIMNCLLSIVIPIGFGSIPRQFVSVSAADFNRL